MPLNWGHLSSGMVLYQMYQMSYLQGILHVSEQLPQHTEKREKEGEGKRERLTLQYLHENTGLCLVR